jgi:hypothetical protein
VPQPAGDGDQQQGQRDDGEHGAGGGQVRGRPGVRPRREQEDGQPAGGQRRPGELAAQREAPVVRGADAERDDEAAGQDGLHDGDRREAEGDHLRDGAEHRGGLADQPGPVADQLPELEAAVGGAAARRRVLQDAAEGEEDGGQAGHERARAVPGGAMGGVHGPPVPRTDRFHPPVVPFVPARREPVGPGCRARRDRRRRRLVSPAPACPAAPSRVPP